MELILDFNCDKIINFNDIYNEKIDDNVKVINNTLYKWNCRIARVDTPELRTRNIKEKQFGYQVRDFLREMILDKIVKVRCLDFDKYGRLLIEIIGIEEQEINISDWLISNNYAFEYNGGKKKQWF